MIRDAVARWRQDRRTRSVIRSIARDASLPRRLGVRLLYSAATTAVLLLLGTAGLSVTTEPEWISLIFEPFSLVFAPGVMLSTLITKEHDYKESSVLRTCTLFYVVLIFGLLTLIDLRGRRRARSLALRSPSGASQG